MSLYKKQENESTNISNFIKETTKEFEIISNPGFSTRSIHEGNDPEPIHGSINVPIHFSSTYKQKSPGELFSKFDYSRAGNPTVDALNTCFASLEHGKFALTFSSGCAASTAIFMTLNSGDHVISIDDVYGGTNRMMNKIFSRFGLKISMIDMTPEIFKKTVTPNTKLVWIETPTNPTLKVVDIEAICKICKELGLISVVDNTFASPYLQSPLLLGADIVLHSCTKYISGHSDVIAGMIVTNQEELYKKIYFNLLSLGGCISPFDAYILLRSVKTLKVRMEEHCKNGFIIAKFLEKHPKVMKVNYPGLKSCKSYEIAKKQMRHPGAMVSFELIGDVETARKFMQNLKLFTLAESLGGVESLIESPALMTHMSVPKDQREMLGIGDTLIRVSIGIENIEDLLKDLEEGFSSI